jgi:hypothetical protein
MKKNKQAECLKETFLKITELEKPYTDLCLKDLESLSAEMYNIIVPRLDDKRKVLLNELLDAETELRLRNQS